MPGNPPFKTEQAQLAVGNESTMGTAATPTRAFGLVTDAASLPEAQVNWLEERVIGGKREIFNTAEGHWSFEGGSIPIVPYDGAPFAYLLGKDTTTANTELAADGTESSVSSGPTLHTIEAQLNDQPPTQTIEAAFQPVASSSANNFVRTFKGCTPTSGEIAVNSEQELTCTLEYMALGVDVGTTVTGGVGPENTQPWLFQDLESGLEMWGTSFARVTDFSLSVNNNIEQWYYIEDTEAPTPFELTYGPTEYDLNVTVTVDDSTLYNEMMNQTNTPFDTTIQFKKPTDSEQLRIIAKNCHIRSTAADIPAEETAVQSQISILPEDVVIKVTDDSNTSAYV